MMCALSVNLKVKFVKGIQFGILGLIALAITAACSKSSCNVVPDVFVMERISLVQYPQLRLPQQPVAINQGGVAGLIVMNVGNDQYVAFDRCSTVDPHKQCAVEVNGLVAKDPCSGATFILTNGSPSNIAECPLKPYRAFRNGETVEIRN